ncbi:hypothetical protein [Teichococcus aestuarii]|nr:hypothetical protein [Pseudoroseomonas aestuarii]
MTMMNSALIPLAVIIVVAVVLLGLNHAEFRAVFRRRRNPPQAQNDKAK